MAEPIKVPAVGESITEGVLARWLKKDGDTVCRGEPLFTLETDKATADVPALADGVLSITVPEGSTVKIESVVGQLEKTGKAARAKPQKDDKPAPAPEKKPERKAAEPVLMPAARQLAADSGVDVRQVEGTGREGRVLKEDVAHYLEEHKPSPPPPPPPPNRGVDTPRSPQTGKPGERETRERM